MRTLANRMSAICPAIMIGRQGLHDVMMRTASVCSLRVVHARKSRIAASKRAYLLFTLVDTFMFLNMILNLSQYNEHWKKQIQQTKNTPEVT